MDYSYYELLATKRLQEFKEELFSLYAYAGTNRETFDASFQKAWEGGHSDGLHSVSGRVDELWGLVDDTLKSVDK